MKTLSIVIPAYNEERFIGTLLDKTFGSLRWRYFGPRPLIEDNSVRSDPSLTSNLRVTRKLTQKSELTLDVFNLFDRKDHDVDYAYVSQITPAAGLGLPVTPPVTLAGQEQVAGEVAQGRA